MGCLRGYEMALQHMAEIDGHARSYMITLDALHS